MTTITQDGTYATLINVFTVDPDRATELAELLTEATEQVIQHFPGFRSANIHISTDGTRVTNYAQWDSIDAYRAMLADPTAREHMTKAAELAISFEPKLYSVHSVHESTA